MMLGAAGARPKYGLLRRSSPRNDKAFHDPRNFFHLNHLYKLWYKYTKGMYIYAKRY